MIVMSRAVARAVRSLARKCLPGGRPRGPAPPVVLHRTGGRLTLAVPLGETTLTWSGPADGPAETVVVPMALFDAVDGPGDDGVEIDRVGSDRVAARWADRGVPRTFSVEAVPASTDHTLPVRPDRTEELTGAFLDAVHEAGRTAAREPTRYALHRVQVRGKKGQVIGTDGKRAYLRSGFDVPFAEDVLVPAVPVFGAKDLGPRDAVRVGRTDSHLVVGVGPWEVYLAIDAEGKFPDVVGALPKTLPTVVTVDDRDADALLDALPGLPGAGEELGPVTLAADEGAFVRAGGESDAVEVRLTRSTVAGPAGEVPMGRADLRRMLALGCRTVRFADTNKPIVSLGDSVTFAAMPLDAGCTTPSTPTATRLDLDEAGRVVPRSTDSDTGPEPRPVTIPIPPPHERTAAMKPTLPPAPPEPTGEAIDPLVEAEGLRTALADVVTRVSRLVAALRHQKREKKALANVWSSLKDLNLGA